MRKLILACGLFLTSFAGLAQTTQTDTGALTQKTAFQTSSAWIPQIDVRSDVAIVYGTHDSKDETFEQRVQSWRDRGYQVAFMTGIAWGQYYDYFLAASSA